MRRAEDVERVLPRMPEPVPLAHGDDGGLGPQDGERVRGHCVRAAVMAHLEDVDVGEAVSALQLVEDVGFGVTGE